jgi:hypothetical protein
VADLLIFQGLGGVAAFLEYDAVTRAVSGVRIDHAQRGVSATMTIIETASREQMVQLTPTRQGSTQQTVPLVSRRALRERTDRRTGEVDLIIPSAWTIRAGWTR